MPKYYRDFSSGFVALRSHIMKGHIRKWCLRIEGMLLKWTETSIMLGSPGVLLSCSFLGLLGSLLLPKTNYSNAAWSSAGPGSLSYKITCVLGGFSMRVKMISIPSLHSFLQVMDHPGPAKLVQVSSVHKATKNSVLVICF